MTQITQQEFEQRLRRTHGGNLICIGRYRGMKQLHRFQCVPCGRIRRATPNGVLYNGNRCAVDCANVVTAKELYSKTMKRQRAIERLGYTVIAIWERDYHNSRIAA